MRKRVFEIIEIAELNDKWSRVYDVFMIAVIMLSIAIMAFKEYTPLIFGMEIFTTTVFIVDYLVRFITSDFKFQKGIKSFFIYPFSFFAIVDLLTILATLTPINSSLKVLRVARLFVSLRVIRVFKIFRYTKSINLIIKIIRKESTALLEISGLAVGFILLSALVMFAVEPDTFGNYFEAVYWAAITLATVGYGDIAPITPLGKFITICISFTGIALILMPASIVTGSYLAEINAIRERELSKKLSSQMHEMISSRLDEITGE